MIASAGSPVTASAAFAPETRTSGFSFHISAHTSIAAASTERVA